MGEEIYEYTRTKLGEISERNEIFINKFLVNLKNKLQEKKNKLREKKDEILKRLKEIDNSFSLVSNNNLFTEDEYNSLRNVVIEIESKDLLPKNYYLFSLLSDLFTE